MLKLLRALTVGAAISAALPLIIVVISLTGVLGPRYQFIDVFVLVGPLVAALLLLAGLLAPMFHQVSKKGRGVIDAVLGTALSLVPLALLTQWGIFGDLRDGMTGPALIAMALAVVCGGLTATRWLLTELFHQLTDKN